MYLQASGNCQGAWAGNMPILSSEGRLPVRPSDGELLGNHGEEIQRQVKPRRAAPAQRAVRWKTAIRASACRRTDRRARVRAGHATAGLVPRPPQTGTTPPGRAPPTSLPSRRSRRQSIRRHALARMAVFQRTDRCADRSYRQRRVGPVHARNLGLRASVERSEAESASTRNHLGVSALRALGTASYASRSR